MDKIAAAKRLRRDGGADFLIEVDGGIKTTNAAEASRAGADVLVAGSSVFRGAGSIGENYAVIRAAIDAVD